MIETLADAVARDPRYAQTTNLVVLRDGELVLERHYGDDSAEELVDVYSVTKSVVSTLVGIALGRGELASLDLERQRQILGSKSVKRRQIDSPVVAPLPG